MTRQRKRTGFTLIDIMAVITVGGILMLLAIAWIGETVKFAARTSAHRRQHQQLTQLAWNFRNDIRSSRSMTMDEEKRLILQSGDGQTVSYSISGTTIEMEKSGGAQVRRERYPLAAGSRIEWDTSGMPDLIGLIISRSQRGTIQQTKLDVADSGNPTANNSEEQDSIPIDIHIFARANRWNFQLSEDANRGVE